MSRPAIYSTPCLSSPIFKTAFGKEGRQGDALQTLSTDLPETIDLILLDGAKALYPEILSLLESRLGPGALIVADNADYSPDYLAQVRSPAYGYMSTPFAEDVELSMRIG